MKFVLVGVSRGALFVRDYDNVSKLKDGAKELVDICRQVLILNGESVRIITGIKANIIKVSGTFIVQSIKKETIIFIPAIKNSSGQ